MAVNPAVLNPYNLEQIGTGNTNNDRLGEPLRAAFERVNKDLKIISDILERVEAKNLAQDGVSTGIDTRVTATQVAVASLLARITDNETGDTNRNQKITALEGDANRLSLGLAQLRTDLPTILLKNAISQTSTYNSETLEQRFKEVYPVDTISKLRELVPTDLKVRTCKVLGYYVAGDCELPDYQWNATLTSADNNGTIIKPNSYAAGQAGRWVAITNGRVSIKWFGAKGDNNTNDAPAIQAAFNSGAKEIFVPEGIYIINTTVTHAGSNFRFYGVAMSSSIFKAGSNVTTLFEFTGGYGAEIHSLQFDGNNKGTSTAIKLTGYHYTVDKLLLGSKWSVGLHLINCWDSHFNAIDSTNDISGKTGTGILLDYSVNISISNSKLGNWEYCIKASGIGNPNSGHWCEGIQISNCILIDSKKGVLCDRVTSLGLSNCIIDLIIEYGIYCYAGFTANILGCWIAGLANNFIGIICHENFLMMKIVGCHFQAGNASTGMTGVVLNGSRFVLSNNTFDLDAGVIYGSAGIEGPNNYLKASPTIGGTANTNTVISTVPGRNSEFINNVISRGTTPRFVLANSNRTWNIEGLNNNFAISDLTNGVQRVSIGGAGDPIVMTGRVGINLANPSTNFGVFGLPAYLSNQAALDAGLVVGSFYHNGGAVRVVVPAGTVGI